MGPTAVFPRSHWNPEKQVYEAKSDKTTLHFSWHYSRTRKEWDWIIATLEDAQKEQAEYIHLVRQSLGHSDTGLVTPEATRAPEVIHRSETPGPFSRQPSQESVSTVFGTLAK